MAVHKYFATVISRQQDNNLASPENKNSSLPRRSQLHSSSTEHPISSRSYVDIGTDRENSVLDRHGPDARDRPSVAPSAPAYPQQHWDTSHDRASFPSTQGSADESRPRCPRLDKEETIIHPQKVPSSSRRYLSRSKLISLGSSIGNTMVSQPMFAGFCH